MTAEAPTISMMHLYGVRDEAVKIISVRSLFIPGL